MKPVMIGVAEHSGASIWWGRCICCSRPLTYTLLAGGSTEPDWCPRNAELVCGMGCATVLAKEKLRELERRSA